MWGGGRMSILNEKEDAIPVLARVGTDPVESEDFNLSPKMEGVVVIVFTDVDVTLDVIPVVQGDYRQSLLNESLPGGETHARVFMFKPGPFKIKITPSADSVFGVAIRSVNYSD